MISWTYIFPGDFFKEKISSLLIAYSMAPGTWKENIAKDYSKEKAPWQKGKEKILSLFLMSLWIKWKKKFSISKNQACQHKHFIARKKEL